MMLIFLRTHNIFWNYHGIKYSLQFSGQYRVNCRFYTRKSFKKMPFLNLLFSKVRLMFGGGWRIFKWTPWSISGKLRKFERTHHPTPLSVIVSCTMWVWQPKNIYPPHFSQFSSHFTVYCGFDTNFVTLYQDWSPNYQGRPKKTYKKHVNMRMDNERIFQVFSENF